VKLLKKDFSCADELLIKKKFSGVFLYVKNGRVEFKKTMGYDSRNLPNSPETIFFIGSLTKQFTAMAILILHEHGILNINNSVSEYIPDYQHGSKITIKHLLSHTSGIPDYVSKFTEYDLKNVNSSRKLINMFISLDLVFQPGTDFQYSNSGYALLGYIIELLSGLSYGQFLQDYIFTPLGMKRSGEIWSCCDYIPIGYNLDGKLIEMSNKFTPYSAGGLFSTMEDLFLWDQGLYSNQLVNEETVKLMFTPVVKWYALGWGPSQDKSAFYHNGNIPGFASLYIRKPLEKSSIICLSNVFKYKLKALVSEFQELIGDKVTRYWIDW